MKTMFAKAKQVLARYLLASALALIFAGCSQPLDTQPPFSSRDTIKALVLGPVESDFLASLKSSLEMTVHDGSQKLEDFDMLILDGDHHTPSALKEDTLVQEALRTGKWVLTLDVTAEHKRKGLGDLLLSATDGTSPAYAAHLGKDANERPFVQVVEHPSTVEEPTALTASRAGLLSPQKLDSSAASAFADLLLERLSSPAQLQIQALPDNLPDNLIYQTFTYSTPMTWNITGSALEHNKPGQPQQHPNFTPTYTFTVFLNNHDNPSGDFQFVLAEADILASPKIDSEDFIAKQLKTSANWTPGWDEWGWFQNYWRLDINPGLSNPDDRLILQQASPATQNGVTTSTTSMGFSIGLNQAQGGNASFTYSQSTSRTITDWQITNEGSGNNTKWYYRTQYPVDNDMVPITGANGAYCEQQIYRSCYIKMDPNELSTDTLSLNTQALWRTEAPNGTEKIVDGWAAFDVDTEHGMLDLFCAEDQGFYCYRPGANKEIKEVQTTYRINLGAVIPIPISSLTFSPNPVKAGTTTTVTGTVTLSKPALSYTRINLSSNSQNATVLPTVVIKPKDTSATFEVKISADGIPAGGSTVATIKAFYGSDKQAQLTITN